ncbi:N terminal of Calcineurin-like phosphoesterase [Catalinimonas alkaloidigena]|uniref:N terminal of Calcineurin-like phosphoesterase n=1 Tax=Catalinimonas alkaloidigena TaxID=1075417 RepID=A0A1G9HJV0_9BACT|nr:calcineurin-like phosphoesterase family protein [Catalinimonas alkaloidigena]SDL13142.1 N terminal of Calcineurin-like phosphoesterase [Catalinimonas alkaloidigena]
MSHNRRFFLKTLGLSSLAFPLAPAVVAAPEPKLPQDVSVVRLSGRVLANGQGLANVAVTDGINVVRTDAKGRYAFDSPATAEFVYLSVPRGYAFPHERGIARFYRRIEPSGGQKQFKADFELEPLSGDDTNHHFIVWADPQIISKEDAAQLKTVSAPDTRALVDSYPQGTLLHGIGCGDLVWDHFELFDDYQEAVATTGIPFFQVIGNHDMDLEARTDDHSANTFKERFGPTYYSFNRGEVHYVVLDDVFFIGVAKQYIGYLTERQLAWLEQDLAHVPEGHTVVVSLHIPANTGQIRRNSTREKIEPSLGGTVANRKELYRLLQPYRAHILSGHTHFNEKVLDEEHENVIEHVHGTVCGAWWTGPICYDGTPSGYGVYEVKGGDIAWFYKSVGHDKTHQLRLYPVGAVPEKPDHLVANVWNWDPQWKVEWEEDGQARGEMTRELGYDPLSVELHQGDQLPKKHAWVDPQLTDHLFFAQPSPNAKHITVRATDRFGNVFSEHIALPMG